MRHHNTACRFLVLSALCASALAIHAPSLLAQDDQPANTGPSSLSPRRAEGLTGSFNATTSPYHFLYVTNPVIGTSVATCNFFNVIVHNTGAEPQQFLAELWRTPNTGGASASSLVNTSGHTTIAGDTRQLVFNGYTIGGGACTTTPGGFFVLKVYSTSASLAVSAYYNTGSPDSAYPGTAAFLFYLPSGAFVRSVMTSSFSFGSSAGVCATTPENSIKVPASKAFPGSPAFGDYGWQNSGTASNTDTCGGAAFADLFSRSSANISGAGKWTFTYQVPNGVYDVTILYNTWTSTAGDTTITLNGRTVVNAVTTPAANVAQVNDRVNVGGNQILIGVLSATGNAVLNGVIITPVAQ